MSCIVLWGLAGQVSPMMRRKQQLELEGAMATTTIHGAAGYTFYLLEMSGFFGLLPFLPLYYHGQLSDSAFSPSSCHPAGDDTRVPAGKSGRPWPWCSSPSYESVLVVNSSWERAKLRDLAAELEWAWGVLVGCTAYRGPTAIVERSVELPQWHADCSGSIHTANSVKARLWGSLPLVLWP